MARHPAQKSNNNNKRTVPAAHRWKLEAGSGSGVGVGVGHPFGVQSLGNWLFNSAGRGKGQGKDVRSSGLGTLAALPDEILLDVVLPTLPVSLLGRLAQTSKAFYVYVYHDEAWRSRLREDFGASAKWTWNSTWRQTYRDEFLRRRRRWSGDSTAVVPVYAPERPLQVDGLFSDHLFQPFHLSRLALEQFEGESSTHNIPRRSVNELSVADFVEQYARPGLPVILTDLVDRWTCKTKWTTEWLLSQFGDNTMRAEAFDMPLKTYLDYSSNLPPATDNPLYLFSSLFPASLNQDFSHPEYFSPDLLDLLPEGIRPTNTWLVLGPARSGSTFHVDPNGTSAFNALIKGRKKWIFFPPDRAPPGVYKSPDGGEVTAPQTLLEWYLDFWDPARRNAQESGIMEAVCEEGECMFVPGGWWHSVLNLSETIALTRNFCAPADLHGVLRFFKDKHEHVSGVAVLDEEDSTGEVRHGNNVYGNGAKLRGVNMYDEFAKVLKDKRPDLWSEWEEYDRAREEQQNLESRKRKAAAGLWQALTTNKRQHQEEETKQVLDTRLPEPAKPEVVAKSGGFSFAFGAGIGEEEED